MDINSLAGSVSGQQMGSLMGSIGVSLLNDQLDVAEETANTMEKMLPPTEKLLDVRA